ncbi:head GIN domain-containing protein [Sphingomonas canadensis]|uniref:Head GIN domain-containing protein n=1 Tax=Sphingomonas canadensis TaxID=1219257 RepID=A0ABW3H0H1_9SPHN|nr:head GIN domain-containing protein [Sphingomonas canadensis]MCW3835142.1 DUF2807 domain-containing protein [Sphingomonas canadensis]
MRALLLLAVLPLAACQSNWEREGKAAAASGSGATREFAADGFTSVLLSGSDDVDVRIADKFSVRAEGDSKLLDQLDIRVVNGELRVSRKPQSGWFQHDRGAKIHVTLPRLTAASLGGSGNLTVERAEGDFSGSVSGSGDLSVGALAGGNANLSIAGSGSLKVAGTANQLEASITGSGDIDAQGLTAASAAISLAGSGDLKGVVKGGASISIVGSGDVELTGGARCAINTVGSGKARCS